MSDTAGGAFNITSDGQLFVQQAGLLSALRQPEVVVSVAAHSGGISGNGFVIVKILPESDQSGQADTFTHWGRRDCPAGTDIVYEGSAAAHYYSSSGSGTNVQCMTHNANYMNVSTGNDAGGRLYRLEYVIASTHGMTSMQALNGYEMPCAVCRPSTPAATFMIPGTLACPSEDDWTTVYKGYLFAAAYTSQWGLNFMCVSDVAQGLGLASASNQGRAYPAEELGLPGAYEADQGREFTCAVCMKNATSPSVGPSGAGLGTYVRWGRTECPAGSTEIYQGHAGGKHYSHSGSGVDPQCFTESPLWAESSTSSNGGA